MEKNAAPSLAADSIPLCVSPADSDRRRLVRVAAGSAVLFVASVVFGLGQSRPTRYESQGSYAPAASTASAIGDEDAYLPTDEARSAGRLDTSQEQAVEQKGSTENSNAPSPAQAHAAHDIYCNLYAAALTGNVTPEQAARREQANAAIVGTISGAVLGAIFGGSGRHSGRSTALGASAGLLAGATIGSSGARQAADDIRRRYAEAYSTCMNQEDGTGAAQPGS